MSGVEIAVVTYLLSAVISFIVAGIILLVRNVLSGGKKGSAQQ